MEEKDRRILVVSQRYWPEDTRINDICREITDQNVRVDVLCGQPNYPSGKYFKGYHFAGHARERHDGIRIFRAPEINRSIGTSVSILLNYYSFPFFSLFKLPLLQKVHYDAILIYQRSPVMMALAGLRLGRKLGIPVTIYAVDVWPQHFFAEMDIRNGLLKRIFRRKSEKYYQQADKIAVANETAISYFTKELHIHPNKVEYIPLCANPHLDKERKDIYIQEKYAGSFNLVWTGRLDKESNLNALIEAAGKIAEAGINDIRFIIAGNGPEMADLRKIIKEKKLHDTVFVEKLESEEDKSKFFCVTDAFISCKCADTRSEYAPVTDLPDYMSAGKPLLVVSGSGERRMVKEARCAVVAESGDSRGIYDGVMRLYRTPEEKLKEMGTRALDYSEKNLSCSVCTGRLLELIFSDRDLTDDGFIINQTTNIIKMEDDQEDSDARE